MTTRTVACLILTLAGGCSLLFSGNDLHGRNGDGGAGSGGTGGGGGTGGTGGGGTGGSGGGSGATGADKSGTLSADDTWTGAINVTGDVTVAAGVTLTISDGALVQVAAG